MEATLIKETFTFTNHPHIKRVLTSMAYENGMVNRLHPIEEYLNACEKEIHNQPSTRIVATEEFIATLTDEEIGLLTGGDVDVDQAGVLAKTDPVTAGIVDQFLHDMFDVC